MLYTEYVKEIENSSISIIQILDRQLFSKVTPVKINKLAQLYNFNNKILKTHSSFYNKPQGEKQCQDPL